MQRLRRRPRATSRTAASRCARSRDMTPFFLESQRRPRRSRCCSMRRSSQYERCPYGPDGYDDRAATQPDLGARLRGVQARRAAGAAVRRAARDRPRQAGGADRGLSPLPRGRDRGRRAARPRRHLPRRRARARADRPADRARRDAGRGADPGAAAAATTTCSTRASRARASTSAVAASTARELDRAIERIELPAHRARRDAAAGGAPARSGGARTLIEYLRGDPSSLDPGGSSTAPPSPA